MPVPLLAFDGPCLTGIPPSHVIAVFPHLHILDPLARTRRHKQANEIVGEVKMVYYFTSNVVDPAAFIYVGKDKVESMGTSH